MQLSLIFYSLRFNKKQEITPARRFPYLTNMLFFTRRTFSKLTDGKWLALVFRRNNVSIRQRQHLTMNLNFGALSF